MNTEDVAGIASLLRPSFAHLGIDLVDVQWSGHGRGAVLRLVIDRAGGGVTLDDCERASNTASAVLDVYDPIDHPYRLEVSSPGAERPIRRPEEWVAAVGRRVNVRLREGESELILEGRLGSVAAMPPRSRSATAGRPGRSRSRSKRWWRPGSSSTSDGRPGRDPERAA